MKSSQQKSLDSWLESLNQEKIDLGLGRCSSVYKNLNLTNPTTEIITVAGTNGKGSTVAILSALLQACGKKTGAFTSPHLIRYNERIRINDIEATDQEIVNAFEKIDAAKAKLNLSYFEYALLAALVIFNIKKVDVIVLEVGLGGRLDASNVVDANCAIITSIGLDHTEWLGNDIESIAAEKAGIFRSNQVAVFADESCPKAIIDTARKLGTDLALFGKDYSITPSDQSFDYEFNTYDYKGLEQSELNGIWQQKNIAAAITALLKLGYELNPSLINKALNNVDLQGRLQVISKVPLVYIDVAHNEQSAAGLAQWLKENPVKGITRAVFSVLADKRFDDWVSCFDGVIDHWFISELNTPRALKITEMRLILADNSRMFSVFSDINIALDKAKQCSEPEDRVIVFGSFYTIAEVLN